MEFDVLVVGAGFAGSVCARNLADKGKKVIIVDKRGHIAGNAYDEIDAHGVLIHPYGPHIFHTNSKRILDFLSQFTKWISYEHRVLAQVEGKLYPIPINRTTINSLYGLSLKSELEVADFLSKVKEHREKISSSEDVVLSSVGRDLCEKFFRGYTRKQWGLDLSELSAGVAARIPTRSNDDDRYFTDLYQCMPAEGYTSMFKNMLSHPNIELSLSSSYEDVKKQIQHKHLIYTGPIDAYFDYCFGKLPYRSLSFEHQHLKDVDRYQAVGTVNYPNDHLYTRITEFKHLTNQECQGTSIVKEFPKSEGEPYYPIPKAENETLYRKYRDQAENIENVTFVGRLAEYRYYNMDQVVGAALVASDAIAERL